MVPLQPPRHLLDHAAAADSAMVQGLRHGGRQCSSSPARCNIQHSGDSAEVHTAAGLLAWRVHPELVLRLRPHGRIDGWRGMPVLPECVIKPIQWPDTAIFFLSDRLSAALATRTTCVWAGISACLCGLPFSALPLVLERFNRVATLSMHLVCTLSCSAAPRRRPCYPLPCQRVAQGSPEWQLLLCGSSV